MKPGDLVYVIRYPHRRGRIVRVDKDGWLLINIAGDLAHYWPHDVELLISAESRG